MFYDPNRYWFVVGGRMLLFCPTRGQGSAAPIHWQAPGAEKRALSMKYVVGARAPEHIGVHFKQIYLDF